MELEVCEQLAGPFGGAVLSLMQATADRLGMNLSDFTCMAVLNAEGPMPAGQLAKRTGMSSAQATLVIDRLEEAGLARRKTDRRDARKVVVTPVKDPSLGGSIAAVFTTLATSMQQVLARYDGQQVQTIARFLAESGNVLDQVAHALRLAPNS